METVRAGTDRVYLEQDEDVSRRVAELVSRNSLYLHRVQDAHVNQEHDNLSNTIQSEKGIVPQKLPIELQCRIIAFSTSTRSLKTLRLVNREWNREIMRHTSLFASLLFSPRSITGAIQNIRNYRRSDRFVASFILWRSLENTVTSITLFKWRLDKHCWFLHLLRAVNTVRVIDCGPWRWLYCLPASVTHLIVKRTVLFITPDLYRLTNNGSRLISLTLDNVRLPEIVCHLRLQR